MNLNRLFLVLISFIFISCSNNKAIDTPFESKNAIANDSTKDSSQHHHEIFKEKIHFAYVNDGNIILVQKDGKVIETQIRGESPQLSSDGSKLVFVGTVVAEKVFPASSEFPDYGTTIIETGIYLWNFENDSITQIHHKGNNPVLSTDGKLIAFEKDGDIYFHDLTNWQSSRIGKGSTPYWIEGNILFFERGHQIMKYSAKKNQLDPALKLEGTIYPFSEKEMKSLLPKVRSGDIKNLYAQMGLSVSKEKNCAGFIQSEITIDNGIPSYLKSIISINTADKTNDYAIMWDNTLDIECLAIESSGLVAAFSVQLGSGEYTVFYAISDGDAKNNTGQGSILIRLEKFEDVQQLDFLDENTLLVSTVDPTNTLIYLNANTFYKIGKIQLEPAQLRLMNLEESIANADVVYKINLKENKKSLFCSGHDITIAP